MSYKSFVTDQPNDTQLQVPLGEGYMTIGVFIDGTCNNKDNTAARKKFEEELADASVKKFSTEAQAYSNNKDGNSYENDRTNVAHLWDAYIQDEVTYKDKVYVEGIGTEKWEADDTMDGVALGHGRNGVVGKMRKACKKAIEICPEGTTKITFDVFGFSRGAAAARSFAYEVLRPDGVDTDMSVTKLETFDDLNELTYSNDSSPKGFLGFYMSQYGFESDEVKVVLRFIGLFDTVASYAKVYSRFDLNPDFEGGAKLLHLNDGLYKARKVLHLVAKNEHRKNYALTPLPSKNDKMTEIELPGVHSDIGGSYRDDAVEKKELLIQKGDIDELKDSGIWLIQQGWFKLKELKIESVKKLNLPTKVILSAISPTIGIINEVREHLLHNKLFGERTLSNQYYKYPLCLMYNHFSDDNIFDSDKIDMKISAYKNYESIPQLLVKYIQTKLEKKASEWKKIEDDYLSKIDISYRDKIQRIQVLQSINGVDAKSELLQLINRLSDHNLIEEELDWGVIKSSDCFDDGTVILYATEQIMLENSKPFEYLSPANILDAIKDNTYSRYIPYSGNLMDAIPKLTDIIVNQLYLKRFRNRFLHWSADYTGAKFDGNMLILPNIPSKDNRPTSSRVNAQRETHYG